MPKGTAGPGVEWLCFLWPLENPLVGNYKNSGVCVSLCLIGRFLFALLTENIQARAVLRF